MATRKPAGALPIRCCASAENPATSVLSPTRSPFSVQKVFTAPTREASGDSLSQRAATLSLCGTVTLPAARRSEEHTSELQSRENLVCRLLLEKKKKK